MYLTKLGRLTIYYSFIFSNFNYCPVTWHFYSELNTNKMKKIQFRALKFICKYKGLVLLTILNVSMAIHVVLIRLNFKVGNLDFVKSSSYVLSVSSQINFRALNCIFSISFVFCSLLKCHVTGQ
jgi:hypothetical protein